MSLVVISIDRSKLPEHTSEDYIAWVKYNVGQVDHLSLSNPLADEELESTVKEIG